MTAKLIEIPSSDTVEMAMPGEEMSWTQHFRYVSNAAKVTAWEVLGDVAAGVPQQGSRYPATPSTNWKCNFVARSVSATPVQQAAGACAYDVRVKWTGRAAQDPTRPWFKITRSTTTRSHGFYRSGNMWTMTQANGTEPFPPVQDMGGVKTDTNGQPVVLPIYQQQIQVDMLWDRSKDNASQLGFAASPDPPMNWYDNYCLSRNSAAFLGWPIGYVTYLGWSLNPSPDEVCVLSHRFLADDFQFLEQRPLPNQSGKPFLDTGLTWGGTGGTPAIVVQAQKYVFWYQPFQTLADYSTLFTIRPNLWTAINTPKPAWPSP